MERGTIILVVIACMILATIVIGLPMVVRKPRTLLWAMPLGLIVAGILISAVEPVLLRQTWINPAATALQATAPPVEVATTAHPQVLLQKAVAEGRVAVRVAGAGLDHVYVTLTPRSPSAMTVIIPAGTLFGSPSEKVQNMVARASTRMDVGPSDDEVSASVPAACVNMHRDVPRSSHQFSVVGTIQNQDLPNLVRQSYFPKQTFRVQQFAIWTITDNPARDEYVGIGSFGFGSGPDDSDMAAIRSVLYWASIEPEKYRAFQPAR